MVQREPGSGEPVPPDPSHRVPLQRTTSTPDDMESGRTLLREQPLSTAILPVLPALMHPQPIGGVFPDPVFNFCTDSPCSPIDMLAEIIPLRQIGNFTVHAIAAPFLESAGMEVHHGNPVSTLKNSHHRKSPGIPTKEGHMQASPGVLIHQHRQAASRTKGTAHLRKGSGRVEDSRDCSGSQPVHHFVDVSIFDMSGQEIDPPTPVDQSWQHDFERTQMTADEQKGLTGPVPSLDLFPRPHPFDALMESRISQPATNLQSFHRRQGDSTPRLAGNPSNLVIAPDMAINMTQVTEGHPSAPTCEPPARQYQAACQPTGPPCRQDRQRQGNHQGKACRQE